MSRTWKDNPASSWNQKDWREFRRSVKKEVFRPKRYYCKTCNVVVRQGEGLDCPICKSIHFALQQVK